MKKLLIATMVVLVAAVAVAQEVTSVNVVGFTKVNVAPGGAFNLVSLPFDAIDPADANLIGVFGTDSLTQVAPASFPPVYADQVWIYDSSALEWSTYYQETDGQFYDSDNWPVGSPTNPPVMPGEGVLIQSSVGAVSTNVVPLMGEVVTVMTQKVDVVSGFQVLGYPFSSGTDIQDTSFADTGNRLASPFLPPVLADIIWILDDAGVYHNYYLNSDGFWYNVDDWTGVGGETPVSGVNLDLGQGFWYQATGGFEWSETNKYLNSL